MPNTSGTMTAEVFWLSAFNPVNSVSPTANSNNVIRLMRRHRPFLADRLRAKCQLRVPPRILEVLEVAIRQGGVGRRLGQDDLCL